MSTSVHKRLKTGAALALALFASAPAFATCGPLTGPSLFPPCIVWDYKRLAQWATTQAQELQKIKGYADNIVGLKAQVDVIGKALDPKSILEIPNVNVFGELKQAANLPGLAKSTTAKIPEIKLDLNTQLFAPSAGSVTTSTYTNTSRDVLAKNANAEAYAFGLQSSKMADDTMQVANRLQKAMEESGDLRTDWAINSQARAELSRQQAVQNYLWQAFLQARSSNSIKTLPSFLDIDATAPTKGSATIELGDKTGQWENLSRLRELVAEAETLAGKMEIVNTALVAKDTMQAVVKRHASAVTAVSNKRAQISNYVVSHSRCSPSQVWSQVDRVLNSIDTQMNALKSKPIDQLSGQMAFRFTNRPDLSGTQYDASLYSNMLAEDVDPRQFIGTWADPMIYQITGDVMESLFNENQILGDCFKKDEERDLRGLLYNGYTILNSSKENWDSVSNNYNSLRLEEAWLREQKDEAIAGQKEMDDLIAQTQSSIKIPLDQANVGSRFAEITREANDLGSKISAVQDPALSEAAGKLLAELQSIWNRNIQEGVIGPLPDPSLVPTPVVNEMGDVVSAE